MKRALDPTAGDGGSSLTPSHKKGSSGKSVVKRPRHSWRPSPATSVKETPGTLLTSKAAARGRDAWPSSAQRKFECMGMYTPVEGLPTEAGTSEVGPPVPFLGSDELPVEDDDFILFSQNDYVRASQVAVSTPVATPDMQQHDADTQVASTSAFAFQSQGGTDEGGCVAHLSQSLTEPGFRIGTQPTVSSQPIDLTGVDDSSLQPPLSLGKGMAPYPRTAYDSALGLGFLSDENNVSQPPALGQDTHAVTPELGGYTAEVVSTSSKAEEPAPVSAKAPSVPRMFNIFMPRSAQRHILIIRHGESEYNRAAIEIKDFKDPLIFDPHLTQKGLQQARGLLSKLQQQIATHGPPLWVVSPLRRALETFLEACPQLERKPSHGFASPGFRQPLSLTLPGQPEAANIEILPTIAEFVASTGDVGTSASVLAKEFPLLANQLSKIPERWWFQGNKKPNCAVLKQFHSHEPKDHRQKRIAELARWLSQRQERFIVMIGHCSFWHEFRNGTEKRMANGEMRSMRW